MQVFTNSRDAYWWHNDALPQIYLKEFVRFDPTGEAEGAWHFIDNCGLPLP
jgi:hypothetical protein